MLQRDYLLRLIEEAGYMLRRLLGLREEKRHPEALELLAETYQSLFALSREELAHTPADQFLDLLIRKYSLESEQLTVLADMLHQEGEIYFAQGVWDPGQDCLRKAILILQHLQAVEQQLYSMERMGKIRSWEQRLAEGPGQAGGEEE